MCRFPLRNIHRYNRVVKRGLIDQATQRFIVWANANFVPLEAKLHVREEALRNSDTRLAQGNASQGERSSQVLHKLHIGGTRDEQIRTVRNLSGLEARYAAILTVRREINVFLRQVSEGEQPFSRVHQMVKNVRQKTGVQPQFEFDGSVLQVRNRLLTTALSLRCDLTILTDFLNIHRTTMGARSDHNRWLRAQLALDFSRNRQDCMDFMADAKQRHQPMHEIEALVFFARFVALERPAPVCDFDRMEQLVAEARDGLATAKSICTMAPSTANMLLEIEDAEKLLRESTFYTVFTNEEKRAVYAAMAQELRGTGHWYYCPNGHPV